MFKKLKAFTLAEALIVIVVIGVISMLTIPVYKKNFEKKGFEAALKKNYAILNNAFERYEVEQYTSILPTAAFSKNFGVKKALMKYLNVYYECKEGEEGQGVCASPAGYSSMYDEINYSGWDHMMNHGQFVLNDGTLIMLGSVPGGQYASITKLIYLDVNGYKRGPNKAGIDLFVLEITSDGNVVPVKKKGNTISLSRCCHDRSINCGYYNGYSCAYDIIMNER